MTDKMPVSFGEGGVQLRSLDDAFRFSTAILNSGLAPKAYQNAEAILVVIQIGSELGFSPMQAIRNMWPGPDGRPNEYVESSWARVLLSGLVEDWSEEVTDESVTFRVTRRGMKTPIVSTYTMDDAKRAGLVKDGGNWAKHPKRMLKARAKGFAIKDGFADILKGIGVAETRDEFYAPPKDVAPPRPRPGDFPKDAGFHGSTIDAQKRLYRIEEAYSDDHEKDDDNAVYTVYDIFGAEIYSGESREMAESIFQNAAKGLTKEEMESLCEVNPEFCEKIPAEEQDHVGSEFGLPATNPVCEPVVGGGLLMPDGSFLLATNENLTKWRDEWVAVINNEKDKMQRPKILASFKLAQKRASSYFSNNTRIVEWIDGISNLVTLKNDHLVP